LGAAYVKKSDCIIRENITGDLFTFVIMSAINLIKVLFSDPVSVFNSNVLPTGVVAKTGVSSEFDILLSLILLNIFIIDPLVVLSEEE
jgi:hypothetical protein